MVVVGVVVVVDELLFVRRLLLPVDPLFIRSVVLVDVFESVVVDELLFIEPVPVLYVPVVGLLVPVVTPVFVVVGV